VYWYGWIDRASKKPSASLAYIVSTKVLASIVMPIQLVTAPSTPATTSASGLFALIWV
jgi:hypothetical protein